MGKESNLYQRVRFWFFKNLLLWSFKKLNYDKVLKADKEAFCIDEKDHIKRKYEWSSLEHYTHIKKIYNGVFDMVGIKR